MTDTNSLIIEQISRHAEKNLEYLENLISEMVRIPSYSGEPKEMQLYLQEKLFHLGMDTKLIKVEPDKLDKYSGFSRDGFPFDNRYSLVGIKKGLSNGRSILLNGHVDVVPPGDLDRWDDNPLSGKILEGKVFGRGSLDMKGGLAAALLAIKILGEMGFQNGGDIIFASSCGEETGGCGAFAIVDDGVHADGCIILEPTKLKICNIQSGCHSFRIKITGKSIHACMAYKGVSAIDKFYLVYDALKIMDLNRHKNFNSEYRRFYENPLNIAPLNVGTVEAGEWPSSVPDLLIATGRMGIFPGESVEEMHSEFESVVYETAMKDPWLEENLPVVEWYEGLFEPAATPLDHDLLKTLGCAHQHIHGKSVEFEAATYGSDMRIFSLYGNIPTVLYGPGDVSIAHTVNEHIEISQVMQAVKSVALALVNWCGGEFSNSSQIKRAAL